jgi:Tetratricopeptide repeat
VRLATSATAAFLLAVSSCVTADTIVLKNGRSIEAGHVTEDAAHVTYQTSAGELSIPRSIVARIDRDNYGYSSASHAAADALVSAPQVVPVPGYEDVERLAVHDQAVDSPYLARLESDALSGTAVSIARVAAAHHAAAQFLLGRGDADAAISHYRHALIFAPDNLGLLLNLAILDIRENQFTAALGPLEHARRVAPDSADTAKLMGWAYYSTNKIDPAIDEWKRAERLRPDPEVERALEKAERDKAEEESYREGETSHFVLKYYGGAAPGLARGVLRALEDDFRNLEAQLDYTPPEPISVILYTEQAFGDITRAPGWVGALNDGRLRIPVRGLNDVTPDLARVLKHELTHSFVGQKSRGHAPVWLQEGVAQWMEGRRSNFAAAALLDAAGQGLAPQLATMEVSWMNLSNAAAAINYAWSLAAVESIIDAGGLSDISRLLDRIATAPSTAAALGDALRTNYDDVAQQTIDYLKRQYAH